MSDFLTENSDSRDMLRPIQPRLNNSPAQKLQPYSPVGCHFQDEKASIARQVQPSQSDVVLITNLDGGRDPEIALIAGADTLPQDNKVGDIRDRESAKCQISVSKKPSICDTLRSMATARFAVDREMDEGMLVTRTNESSFFPDFLEYKNIDDMRLLLAPSEYSQEKSPLITMCQRYASMQPSRTQDSLIICLDLYTSSRSGTRELAPMPFLWPDTLCHQHITPPSIRSTLGNHQNLSESCPHYTSSGQSLHALTLARRPDPSPMLMSPRDVMRSNLLTPGQRIHENILLHYPLCTSNGLRHDVKYNSSNSTTTEIPSNTICSLPVTEKMRIDNLTQTTKVYVCTFTGCTAQPFQTKYLLKSHANVHSSSRPHYCPVHGCPRAIGGKGFKRKNEMLRHRLVHDSPGYICPFCPNRRHKYPRPDNLQRYALFY